MKVYIENFQNIDTVEFEIDGFTTIVGKSNIGKSSIRRAIEGAIHNKSGDDFVRHGCSNAGVRLENDDLDLRWIKGEKNDYEIDGDYYESVGHGPPDIIFEKGYGSIDVDRSNVPDVDPQIAKQFSPIFLINPSKTPGSIAAEVISDIGRLSDVQQALKDCSSDRREKESTLDVRRQDIDDHEDDLEQYDDLDETIERVDEIESLREDIESLRSEIETLEQIQKARDDLKDTIETLESVERIEIPSLDDLDHALSEISNLSRLRSSYRSVESEAERLSSVESIDIPTLDGLDECIEEIETLASIRDDYSSIQDDMQQARSDIDQCDDQIERAKSYIEQFFEEAGKCPLCEQDIAHDHSICREDG